MKHQSSASHIIRTITEYNQLMGLPKPAHPLIVVNEITGANGFPDLPNDKLINDFYCISIKHHVTGFKYGRQYYDFREGVMAFTAPKQVFVLDRTLDISAITGWFVIIHPDFIRQYPLGSKIKEYGFFSYDVNEALHLSEKEEEAMEKIILDIRTEYQRPIDAFSQDVMVSYLELLLNHANRFYNRQFITRSSGSQQLPSAFQTILQEHFEQKSITKLPTVQEIASQLNVSPHYLSDMLRSLTGQSAQQHIHNTLIEKAKEILLTTGLTINETAYQLGFEYPPYFNRLFKSKTGLTPAAFRSSKT
jgi:AraC-like DNA-binding protein